MKFVQRLGYYLGGFAIGLILLLFFLNGKDASCDYGPNARTVKNIASKRIVYNETIEQTFKNNEMDSTIVRQLIRYGSVDFSESDIKSEPCKIYHIENSYKERDVILKVENCDSIAKVISFKFN
ncbi:hypothetical protein [Winogradskyella immobilis]|uniref:DUF4258 domain-containing protein n=1 Tax=Winogradskyella immobilis TaxID=2816852 RepID=A0ABS8EN80_9FLAO|nr:hypothetical protein [Winogradskyella immobilis]MCC1484603.1 hypothetical protein [Winogradskyella immobilis]MCG0016695.1 hypothetical protein [Winogradskyella immobilis]